MLYSYVCVQCNVCVCGVNDGVVWSNSWVSIHLWARTTCIVSDCSESSVDRATRASYKGFYMQPPCASSECVEVHSHAASHAWKAARRFCLDVCLNATPLCSFACLPPIHNFGHMTELYILLHAMPAHQSCSWQLFERHLCGQRRSQVPQACRLLHGDTGLTRCHQPASLPHRGSTARGYVLP